jgi:Asp-tRNA(Asn)/Glu-tRNA(Gln) amidotransferase A subunit family amidase
LDLPTRGRRNLVVTSIDSVDLTRSASVLAHGGSFDVFRIDTGRSESFMIGMVASESAEAFDALTRHEEPKGVKGWPQFHLLGNFLTAVDYLKLNRMRAIIMQRFDRMMQAVDIYLCNELLWTSDREPDDQWDLYGNLTGHPMVVYPKKFEKKDGLLMPQPGMMIGRLYDESTLLTLAHACQQRAQLTHHPPLDQFLSQKDETKMTSGTL